MAVAGPEGGKRRRQIEAVLGQLSGGKQMLQSVDTFSSVFSHADMSEKASKCICRTGGLARVSFYLVLTVS